MGLRVIVFLRKLRCWAGTQGRTLTVSEEFWEELRKELKQKTCKYPGQYYSSEFLFCSSVGEMHLKNRGRHNPKISAEGEEVLWDFFSMQCRGIEFRQKS